MADLGCGKLRHYTLLLSRAQELFLVDTPEQLSATHFDGGEEYTILDVAKCARRKGRVVHATSFNDFASGNLGLDLIVCVAVLDVVLPRVRTELIKSAAANLGPLGYCAIIAPRNDSTILKRCGEANAYSDGHIFSHHGVQTFFHNFRNHTPIIRACGDAGLRLLKDLSCYRQVCLVFGRQPGSVRERSQNCR